MSEKNVDLKKRFDAMSMAMDGLSPHDRFGLLGGMFGKIMTTYNPQMDVGDAINVLSEELANNKKCYDDWHSGISEAYIESSDLMLRCDREDSKELLRTIANRAATVFLKSIIKELPGGKNENT